MKQFLTVLNFELSNYFKKKSFVITTLILASIIAIILTLPSFFDFSKLIPSLKNNNDTSIEESTPSANNNEKTNFALLDSNSLIKDTSILEGFFPNSNWIIVNSISEIEDMIIDNKVSFGFEIKSPTEFNYLVKNNTLGDPNKHSFEMALKQIYQANTITEAGYNYSEINEIYNTKINSETTILGKDSANNYFYAYILVFILYMMIIMYGQLIAMSVTAEKSTRAIEILVTSTSTNSLIFGKVIAGALASIAQVSTILATGMIFYKFNSSAWNGLLDNVFNIPAELLIAFALFGIVGYLLYSLIFGALGALVSKTEEIGSSVTPIMLIFVATFLLSMYGLSNSDSLLIKITSFIPFCSPMVMLVRIAMGTVTFIEVSISFIILIISCILAGLGASKIYRNATLMYGNPIKFKNTFKWLINKNN